MDDLETRQVPVHADELSWIGGMRPGNCMVLGGSHYRLHAGNTSSHGPTEGVPTLEGLERFLSVQLHSTCQVSAYSCLLEQCSVLTRARQVETISRL